VYYWLPWEEENSAGVKVVWACGEEVQAARAHATMAAAAAEATRAAAATEQWAKIDPWTRLRRRELTT